MEQGNSRRCKRLFPPKDDIGRFYVIIKEGGIGQHCRENRCSNSGGRRIYKKGQGEINYSNQSQRYQQKKDKNKLKKTQKT